MNMASNCQEDSDEGSYQLSNESSLEFSDTDSEAENDSGSGVEDDGGISIENVCTYYNRGKCRYGDECKNVHICKDFLKGSCKFGAGCRLNHNSRSSGRGRSSSEDEIFEGPYRWQMNFQKGWKNICNDHILEAQYSLPNTKGIKLYNTQAGAVSIDFTKMRVLQKTNIKVRRLSAGDTEWLWYYRGDHCWCRYGGQASAVQSSQLETEYQKNRHGSFKIDSTPYEISFKEMCQRNLSTGNKRRVRRRPKYEPPQNGGLLGITSQIRTLLSPSTPKWQFEGSNRWYTFKKKQGGCSVSSADIENCYQQNPTTMSFTVNGDGYVLDFAKLSQVNLRTKAERKVRRV